MGLQVHYLLSKNYSLNLLIESVIYKGSVSLIWCCKNCKLLAQFETEKYTNDNLLQF